MSSNGRDRILDSAWELLASRGDVNASMSEIARAAGLSRQAVYLHFDSRAGLLTAMARRQDERLGFDDAMRAAAELDGAAALERMLDLWFDHVPRILPVARALEAVAVQGEEGGEAWEDRMRDLRAAFRAGVRKLDAAGGLGDGWDVQTATDWIWARTHLTQYAHLVSERGWSQREFARRITASLLAEIAPN